jgi:hypothetical protein
MSRDAQDLKRVAGSIALLAIASLSILGGAHRHEVVVGNWTNILRAKRYQRLCPA